MNKNQQPIIEDNEILGPGALLSEARLKQNFSIDYVASKLNFRAVLVENIEADNYDKSLPDTYNRGYIKNYAKLVGIPLETIIDSYEKLNLFQENNAKMQSFSRGTSKKAQNNILMWITYLIIASFLGVTMMWWLQDDKSQTTIEIDSQEPIADDFVKAEIETRFVTKEENNTSELAPSDEATESISNETLVINESNVVQVEPEQLYEGNSQQALTNVEAIFSFSGDCWVNIHDATGARIAWGIKKAGYVMPITGKAPLNITVGKPELVEIKFNGIDVDMSPFRTGHISKFTLPLTPDAI